MIVGASLGRAPLGTQKAPAPEALEHADTARSPPSREVVTSYLRTDRSPGFRFILSPRLPIPPRRNSGMSASFVSGYSCGAVTGSPSANRRWLSHDGFTPPSRSICPHRYSVVVTATCGTLKTTTCRRVRQAIALNGYSVLSNSAPAASIQTLHALRPTRPTDEWLPSAAWFGSYPPAHASPYPPLVARNPRPACLRRSS